MGAYDLKEEQIATALETFRSKFGGAIEYDRSLKERGAAEKEKEAENEKETATEAEAEAGDCKLAVYNGCLYVQPYFPLQCVSRWLGAQSRAHVYNFIDEEAIEFIQFLEKFVFTFEVREVDAAAKDAVGAFVADFVSALRRLREVYPSYAEFNTLLANVVGVVEIYGSILERYKARAQ